MKIYFKISLIIYLLFFLPTCAVPIPQTKADYKVPIKTDYYVAAETYAKLAKQTRKELPIMDITKDSSTWIKMDPKEVDAIIHAAEAYNIASQACYFAGKGDFLKAAQTMEKALKEAELGKKKAPPIIYICNQALGDFYLILGEFSKAEATTLRALSFLEKNRGANIQYAQTYNQLVDIYRKMGKPGEAAQYEERIRNLPEGKWWR
jgi:tetratricopeptide (TPR) repeat protein